MGVKVNSELAAFFETGDQPSQAEFGHLIDSMLPTPVVLPETPASQPLNRDDHQGRTIIVPDVNANTTYTMPAPLTEGENYHFVYGGNGADAHNHIFVIGGATTFLKGAIQWINNNIAVAAGTPVYLNGSSHTTLTLNGNNLGAYNLHFCSISTTVVHVWGFVGATSTPTVSS